MVKDFETYFNKELAPQIENLAGLRNELFKKFVLESALMISLFLVLLFILQFIDTAEWARTQPFFFGLIILIAGNYKIKHNIYNKLFKQNVIDKMIYDIDDRLTYRPLSSVWLNSFSKIFEKDPKRFVGEDLIEGTIGKTKITFSEVKGLRYKPAYQNNNRNSKTKFKGIVFCADFNKNFKHKTVIVPKNNRTKFYDVVKNVQEKLKSNSNLIKMDHPEFENLFEVYSEDSVEAFYLLSPNLMERILLLQEKFNNTIYLSFNDSQLYIAISNDINLFEAPPLWSNSDFMNLVKTYHSYLHNCLEIANDLNLNVRIWGKE